MTLPPRVRELPASAKLAYRTLEREGELTQEELREAEGLPRRTACRALETLECHDLVRVRESTRDARQQVYALE